MHFNSFEIAAIAIGLSIFAITLSIGILSSLSTTISPFTTDNVFYLKKWAFIAFIFLINALGCILVYYTSNLQVIIYIILALKSKDILMALSFPINMIIQSYRHHHRTQSIEAPRTVQPFIVAFVPTFKESPSQVSRTIDSIVNQCKNENTIVFLVSDGLNDNMHLIDDVKYTHDISYTSWTEETIQASVTYGFHNGAKIIILQKSKNVGKKDSIILCHDIFDITNSNANIRSEIQANIKSVFDIAEFEYIFGTDADTIVSDNTFDYLVESIETRNAVASCGILNPDKSQGSMFWNHLQNFQYMYGQYMRRTNEDLFNQVLCLPGCVSMFKIDGHLSKANEEYRKNTDPKSLVASCVSYVGTDRRITSLLVSTCAKTRIVLDTRVQAYTCVPSSVGSYLSQRKRWCQNMYFNTLVNIVSPNVNFVLRFYSLVDFLRLTLSYFRLFNTLYFIFLLTSLYSPSDILNIIPFIVILSYPILMFLIYSLINPHLRRQYISLVLSMICNKVFTFMSTIVIFTSMLFNIGNKTW